MPHFTQRIIMQSTHIYNEAFYNAQMKGSYESALGILPYVQKYIDVKNVIDVGCGVGTWLKAWQDMKPDTKVFGIDGNSVDHSLFFISTECYQRVDLTQDSQQILQNLSFKPNGGGVKPFSLAQSLEVAEHFDAQYAKNFITLLTSLADVVLFSAAIPHQGGTHHVNEQPPAYWAELFAQHDYVCLDYIRMQVWHNPKIESWYRQNTLVFVHKRQLEHFEGIAPTSTPPYIVHPELWEIYTKELERLKRKLIFRISVIIKRILKAPIKILKKL